MYIIKKKTREGRLELPLEDLKSSALPIILFSFFARDEISKLIIFYILLIKISIYI